MCIRDRYEGEQEGPYRVALALIGQSVKTEFLNLFPNPDQLKKGEQKDPYGTIRAWFAGGNTVDLLNDAPEKEYKKTLDKVAGLKKMVEGNKKIPKEATYSYMELVLHGLCEFNVIGKDFIESKMVFSDILAKMWDDDDDLSLIHISEPTRPY